MKNSVIEKGFNFPFLIVIVFGVRLLLLTHIGENAKDFGIHFHGVISYCNNKGVKISNSDRFFYFYHLTEAELKNTTKLLKVGREVDFWYDSGRGKIMHLISDDKTLVEYSWWKWNKSGLFFVLFFAALIPFLLAERRAIIQQYGPSADPSYIYTITKIFRRSQRPFIDDERTADKSVNEQKATKK